MSMIRACDVTVTSSMNKESRLAAGSGSSTNKPLALPREKLVGLETKTQPFTGLIV